MRTERILIALAIIALPGLLLAPVWGTAGLGAGEDDILYYFPSRVFFHETITNGQWPWLNPWTGLDRPFAADPQSALWYPFTWLFALLPPLVAYPVSLWAHYSIAAWGMYRLLRSSSLSRQAALFGGLVFMLSGFMLAHRVHFAMQHAAAWAPWVFWRMQRYVLAGRTAETVLRTDALRLCAACGVAALQCFSGHVQIAALTAVGTIVYLLACTSVEVSRRVLSVRWLLVWVCAAGLFAVQWLPTLAYVPQCTRVDRTYADFVENSWYPSSAIGWLLPMFYGQRTENFFSQAYWGPSHQCEQFGYVGIVPLLLAALALRAGWRSDPDRRPWIILLIFGLLLALGMFGPVCPFLYLIPGSSLFRVPARALLLFNIGVAVLAARALHDLGAAHTARRVRLRATLQRWTRRPFVTTLLLLAVPLCAVLVALPLLPSATRAAALYALRPWNPALFVPLIVALISVTSLSIAARQWRRPSGVWLPVLATALDLGVIGWTIDVPAGGAGPAELLTTDDRAWVASTRESKQRLWAVTDTAGVYADPLTARVANTNALVHVRSLTDYGPLQPRMLAERFAFKPWGVSTRADELLRSTDWMRAFNVGWILLRETESPPPADCDLIDTTAAGWQRYHNPTAAGMVFFDRAAQPGAVSYCERSCSEFVTTADTWPPTTASTDSASWPLMIVSRLALPGWRATYDGQPVSIEIAHDALLAIRVPPGQTVRLEWSYFPPALREGAIVSGLSVVVLALSVVLTRRVRADSRAESA